LVIIPFGGTVFSSGAEPSGGDTEVAHSAGEHYAGSGAGDNLRFVVIGPGQINFEIAGIGVIVFLVVIDGGGNLHGS